MSLYPSYKLPSCLSIPHPFLYSSRVSFLLDHKYTWFHVHSSQGNALCMDRCKDEYIVCMDRCKDEYIVCMDRCKDEYIVYMDRCKDEYIVCWMDSQYITIITIIILIIDSWNLSLQLSGAFVTQLYYDCDYDGDVDS